ncbi:AfsR/SARP family transcriptional regulator [Micromonospora aurantiaca (nom. illeg.)]|uniref:AfsR/SARP family transcriptional regulator n=1 Tax=Micromonospora aurantiaca (nom. illeg.) TaxID=47850 RepID=UPI0014768359|nr:BTAD domain-containing putative transcriptional regulator [Micromonospora aurantiaca]
MHVSEQAPVFRILGRIEVANDGTISQIRGGRTRALLVTLLLQESRVVALNRIIEAMWGYAPPQSAVANVRTHVWNLRQQISKIAEIRSHVGGYEIRVPSGACDYSIFAERVSSGRAALASGEPARAVDLLVAGLDLWHADTAAAGLPRYGPLEGWLDHLDDERARAVEDLAEAYLSLGEARAALRELKAPLDVARLRSRNWVLKMKAYRQLGEPGRVADTFREAKLVFEELLGARPDEELYLAYRSIING